MLNFLVPARRTMALVDGDPVALPMAILQNLQHGDRSMAKCLQAPRKNFQISTAMRASIFRKIWRLIGRASVRISDVRLKSSMDKPWNTGGENTDNDVNHSVRACPALPSGSRCFPVKKKTPYATIERKSGMVK